MVVSKETILLKNKPNYALSKNLKIMNKSILSFVIAILFFLCSCEQKNNTTISDTSKTEILDAEKAFAAMAKKDGVAKAFSFYAAEDAAINYNDKLIKGRKDISVHYENKKYKDVLLEWTPEFVDAAASGDLGYTYGNYTYTTKDSIGNIISAKGIFHTVWKKQKDGSWKFVWD